MTNELAKQDLNFDVTVNTEIKINDKEKLEALVSAVEKKYSGLVFTDDNEKEAKETRAELNKIKDKLDDGRKRIKKTFNEPLKAFEAEMNGYTKRIEDVTEPIKEGLADLEKRQREERKQDIIKLIAESAENYDLEPDEVKISDSWLIKSLSAIKRTKLVTDEMTRLKQIKEKKANDITVIKSYCEALSIDNGGWLVQLDNGVSSEDLMKQIDEFVKSENERIEREKQAQIERERNEAERLKQAELAQKEVVENIVENPEDLETIETIFVPQSEIEQPLVVEPELETLVLRFTGTSEQINALSDYIVSSGIHVEKI